MPAQDAETMDETRAPVAPSERESGELQIQPAGFLLLLSLDWIVLRASENVDDFLGESHVTLIDEPFSRFVQAQALHDLRNLFSRLSGSTGIAKAYRVRLTDDRPRYDIAFQVSEGRVLLEGAPSPERGVGTAIGSVGGLIDGLSEYRGEALLDAAARRVRALTGCDRSLILYRDGNGERSAHNSRGSAAAPTLIENLPAIVTDTTAAPVSVFPRKPGKRSNVPALLRAPSDDAVQRLRGQEIAWAMSVPMTFEGRDLGLIQCHNGSARGPNFELHAAAELFAQMLATRLELDRLRS